MSSKLSTQKDADIRLELLASGSGEILTHLNVTTNTTMKQLQQQIASATDVPKHRQKVLFGEIVVSDARGDNQISKLGIVDGSQLALVTLPKPIAVASMAEFAGGFF